MTGEQIAGLMRIEAARLANVARSLQIIARSNPELDEQLRLVWESCEACEVIVRAQGRKLATGAPLRLMRPSDTF